MGFDKAVIRLRVICGLADPGHDRKECSCRLLRKGALMMDISSYPGRLRGICRIRRDLKSTGVRSHGMLEKKCALCLLPGAVSLLDFC